MPTATPPEQLLTILSRLMAELHPEAASRLDITLDSRLDRDLGLDSLARMELLTRLEQSFAVRLPEKVLTTVETPRDLLRHLAAVPAEAATGTGSQPTEFGAAAGSAEVRSAATLLEVLDRHAAARPDAGHILLLQGEREQLIGYGELRERAIQVAGLLQSLQLEPGDRVAIMLPTGADYFFCFFGILYAGCVPVPLYPPARPSQIEEHLRRHRKILANAGTRILVTVQEVKTVALLLQTQVPVLERVLTVEELYLHDQAGYALPVSPESTAFLQYTSGSTGDPKGVILSHANLLANIRAMGQVCGVTADDVFVSWLPLYHDMGLIGAWLGSLYHGCRLVVMPPLSFIARPERWLQAIDRYRGTLSASPNFGYELCCSRLDDKDLAELDLSSWRMAFNGAEPVIPATLQRFEERFARCGYRPSATTPVYGLAESSVGLAFPPVGRGVLIDRIDRDLFLASGQAQPATDAQRQVFEFVCCGRPLPGHQIRIVDAGGRELPDRHEGRLQFKGPSATSGYFRSPDKTRELFRDGWLDSGDMAYIAAGEVYITSRIKDIIIRGGRNVYPHELEDAVGGIPGIRRGCTAVFGSKDPKTGTERLIVLTESRKRRDDELAALRRQVNAVTVDLLGMPPDEVLIAPPGSVLKTSSGKIRRAANRQLFESGRIGRKKAAVWLQLLRMGLAGLGPLAGRMLRRAAATLYAGWCWLVLGLTGGLFWVPIVVSPGLDLPWRLARIGVRLIGRLTGIKMSVDGMEHFPADGQFLVACNHMSYLDGLVLTAVLPRRCSFVAKAELGRNPALRLALEKLGTAFVERFDIDKGLEDVQRIEAATGRGVNPLFFAEGTLQRMPGLLPFQMGAFVLAARQQLPVVPVTIRGTRNILRGGSWFPRRGRVDITISEACRPTGSDWPAAIELRERVRGLILRHLGEPDLAGEYTSLTQMDIARPPAPDR
ncbi:MAG: AMP-binding protein [Desulfobulbaceae bacterium]|nr:MAG: AMP-binding protein [Desulfobulbaceae bacterium]